MIQVDTSQVEVQHGITEDQAVSQLLEKWAKPAEQTKSEADAEEPKDEQSKDDAKPEEEADEAEGEGGEIELDVAGEKFKVPKAFEEVATRMQAKAKEVEAGATRKFQEAAEARKAADAQIAIATQLQKIAEANADLIGDNSMIARRLRQIESINIADADTDALTRLNAEYNQLTAAQKRIADQYQQNIAKQREEEGKAIAARREHAEKQLAAEISGWGPEYQKTLAEYAVSRGMPQQVLQSIADAWMVRILDDAVHGRKMREAKPQVEKRVAEAQQKTLKPGASGQDKSANSAKVEQLAKTHKQAGTVESAAALFLARSAQKRK